MPTQCLQSLNNGRPCSAPAVNGSKFCRHHDPQRPPKPVAKVEKETLVLPHLLDKVSVLAAINEVVQAIANDQINLSVAGTLLSAFKLASRLLTEVAEEGIGAIRDHDLCNATLRKLENTLAKTRQSYVPDNTVALAASAQQPRRKDTFSASHPFPEADSATARLVQELIAQSHQFATNLHGKGPELKAAR